MNRILHLSLDDKFIDIALPYFNRISHCNDLVVLADQQVRYVKSKAVIVNDVQKIIEQIDINKYGLIIIHALDPVWYQFVLNLPKTCCIVWLGWGYDYYSLLNNTFLLKKTRCVEFSLKESIKKAIFTFKRYSCRKLLCEVIERIDYFSPVLDIEYNLVKNAVNTQNFPKYIPFTYGSLETDFGKDFLNSYVTGNNILVGNSATATNNHIEVFDLLKQYTLKNNQKIFCPLSYGDTKYKKSIEKLGYSILGEKFQPIVQFLPITEYIEIIGSCSIVIMNHVRQQALGNILSMLYLGATVYLREENPIYMFLIKNNIKVFSIKLLEEHSTQLEYQLSRDDVEHNRKILQQLYSYEATLHKSKDIVSLLAS